MKQWVDDDERGETWNSTGVCTPSLEGVCGQSERKNSGWGGKPVCYLWSLVLTVCALLLSFQNCFCCNACVFSIFQFLILFKNIFYLFFDDFIYVYNIFNHIHPKVFHFLSPKTTATTSSSHLISFFFLVTPGVQLVLLTRILADLIDCSCAGLRQVT